MSGGRVIVLNGASSSGKSSLAAALLEILAGPWTVLAVDDFHSARSRGTWTEAEFAPIMRRTVLGFHRAVAGFASAGNDVIVDHVLSEPWRREDLASQLTGLSAVLVAVNCPLEELERREAARGDRPPGLAARQAALLEGVESDMVVDTLDADPAECADRIQDFMESKAPAVALATLRRDHPT